MLCGHAHAGIGITDLLLLSLLYSADGARPARVMGARTVYPRSQQRGEWVRAPAAHAEGPDFLIPYKKALIGPLPFDNTRTLHPFRSTG